ncbi:ARF guanine-nucleotide exchange factor GNOM [Porphyridium purpureum]|uniref:ARF guanine-nucleotide exchange factor GNOM n=1 Tax=Porphyridium purpureum TaxID=35688 RepID=A0A5J4YUE7_PORPP|nr:ARF guanine-nucleotide exchange factor GNOM [Porphyridium purpureum]|eukprot:POR2344..scf229_5
MMGIAMLLCATRGESNELLGMLRQNARFRKWNADVEDEHELLRGLLELQVFSSGQFNSRTRSASELDLHSLVRPFCNIISSPLVSGIITSKALSAVARILPLVVANAQTAAARISAVDALNQALATIANVRFEATDSVGDQSVFLHVCFLYTVVIEAFHTLSRFSPAGAPAVPCEQPQPGLDQRSIGSRKRGIIDLRWVLLSAQAVLRICVAKNMSELLREAAQAEFVRATCAMASMVKRAAREGCACANRSAAPCLRGYQWACGSTEVGAHDELYRMLRSVSKLTLLDVTQDASISEIVALFAALDLERGMSWGPDIRYGIASEDLAARSRHLSNSYGESDDVIQTAGNESVGPDASEYESDAENDHDALSLGDLSDEIDGDEEINDVTPASDDGRSAGSMSRVASTGLGQKGAISSSSALASTSFPSREPVGLQAICDSCINGPRVFAGVLNVLLRMSAAMLDPKVKLALPDRVFGADILSQILESQGSSLDAELTVRVREGSQEHLSFALGSCELTRRVLLKQVSRSLLRSLGAFCANGEYASPSFSQRTSKSSVSRVRVLLAALFRVSLALCLNLGRFCAPFLQQLLGQVFPTFYSATCEPIVVALKGSLISQSSTINDSASTVRLDPDLREIGLNGLQNILEHPADLLRSAFCTFDCGVSSRSRLIEDVVQGLSRAAMLDSARRISLRRSPPSIPGLEQSISIVCEYGDNAGSTAGSSSAVGVGGSHGSGGSTLAGGTSGAASSRAGTQLVLEEVQLASGSSPGTGARVTPYGPSEVDIDETMNNQEERLAGALRCASIVMSIMRQLKGSSGSSNTSSSGTSSRSTVELASPCACPTLGDSISTCSCLCPEGLAPDSLAQFILKRKKMDALVTKFNLSRAKKAARGVLALLDEMDDKNVVSMGNAGENFPTLSEEVRAGDASGLNGEATSAYNGDEISRVAEFLFSTPGLAKSIIGEILGSEDGFSVKVLQCFTQQFNFANVPYTSALRIFLESFRLPGEAQKIDRIMHAFAAHFYAENHKDPAANVSSPLSAALSSPDAAYVLAFAVVMLNTDQHNESVRKKMVFQDFVRNNRGINDGQNVPEPFLRAVFDSIREEEIKIAEESGIGDLTDAGWDHILACSSRGSGSVLRLAEPLREADALLFERVWVAGVRCAHVALYESNHPAAAKHALGAFFDVGMCGARYRSIQACDMVIATLIRSTRVLQGSLLQSCVSFGTSIKSQMITRALFRVVRRCSDWMRESGWSHVVALVLRLETLDLLPDSLNLKFGTAAAEFLTVNGQDVQEFLATWRNSEYAQPAEQLLDSPNIPPWWPFKRAVFANVAYFSGEAAEKRTSAKGGDREPTADSAIVAGSAVNGTSAARKLLDLFRVGTGSSSAAGSGADASADDPMHEQLSSAPSFLADQRDAVKFARKQARECVLKCMVEEILISDSRFMRPESLQSLSSSLAHACWRMLDLLVARTPKHHQPIPSASKRGKRSYASVVGEDKHMVDYEALLNFSSGRSASSSSSYAPAPPVSSTGSGIAVGTATSDDDSRKARELVAAFCVDVMLELALKNRDRLPLVWPHLHETLLRVFAEPVYVDSSERHCFGLLERALVCLFRVGSRFAHRKDVLDDVFHALEMLRKIRARHLCHFSLLIATGILQLVSCNASIESAPQWKTVLLLLLESGAVSDVVAADFACQVIQFVISSSGNELHPAKVVLRDENFAVAVNCVYELSRGGSAKQSVAALDIVLLLCNRIPELEEDLLARATAGSAGAARGQSSTAAEDKDELGQTRDKQISSWDLYWFPLLSCFLKLANDNRGGIRNYALLLLERIMASGSEIDLLGAPEIKHAIDNVLLPLVDTVFPKQGAGSAQTNYFPARTRRDLEEIEKSMLRAVVLLSKFFLQHHAKMAAALEPGEFGATWRKLLQALRRAVTSHAHWRDKVRSELEREDADTVFGDDLLSEHVSETVTNMVLVMAASGLMQRSDADPMWKETLDVTASWIPGLSDMVQVTQRAS